MKGTASLYDVSYSQVYSWVRKYDITGEDGLSDKRGRHKTDDEVDELERLRRENMRLKRQLEEKDMVVELQCFQAKITGHYVRNIRRQAAVC